MTIKISKKDAKDIVAQCKMIIKNSEIEKKIAKEAIRKCNINITTAAAIMKGLV